MIWKTNPSIVLISFFRVVTLLRFEALLRDVDAGDVFLRGADRLIALLGLEGLERAFKSASS